MVQILVAESDAAEALTVSAEFRRHGFEAALVTSGLEAAALAPEADLLVLGLQLPDLNGLEVCRRIRIRSDVPIIATGAQGTEIDIVEGLRAGFDACLVHPYGLRELLARAQAILRRTHRSAAAVGPISLGPLRLNPRTREAHARGRQVQLTRKEFDLLYLLAAQPTTLFSRRHIMSVVWGDERAQSSRTIDTHVSSLRGKLGDVSAIRTVRSVGFRIGYQHGGFERASAPGSDS